MRRKVCYTFRRMVFHAMKRLRALKEGFNVKNGNSLKAFEDYRRAPFPYSQSRLMEGLFSALFHCPKRMGD